MDNRMQEFRMPRYHEIPDVGLYLEQTIKYINSCLAPLDIAVTASMVSNYVKKGYVDRPIKKEYYAEQIAYLLFLALAKQTLSMENIAALFALQKKTYPGEVAYNYFCDEFENLIQYVFGNRKELLEVGVDHSEEKELLRVALCSIAQKIYLDHYLRILREEQS